MKKEVKELSKEEFRKMQLLEVEMLKELDRVCRKNNVRYTICGGTLLGAVRHKGFIPWDDDIDVIMLREDYEKFKKIANQMDPKICYFQNHQTDPYYRWSYSKIRKTNTEYVRIGQEHIKCKTGFFIDIFPMDDIPRPLIGQILCDFYCFCLRKILYSEVGKVSENETWFMRKWYSLLSHIPVDWVHKRLHKMSDKSKNDRPNRVRCYTFPATGKLYIKNPIKVRYGMPKKWFLNLTEYEFEGYKFFGTKDYDEILSYTYGDYMTLPPVEKRVVHAPVSSYSFDVEADKLKKKKSKSKRS